MAASPQRSQLRETNHAAVGGRSTGLQYWRERFAFADRKASASFTVDLDEEEVVVDHVQPRGNCHLVALARKDEKSHFGHHRERSTNAARPGRRSGEPNPYHAGPKLQKYSSHER
jgi:hypothetical protein